MAQLMLRRFALQQDILSEYAGDPGSQGKRFRETRVARNKEAKTIFFCIFLNIWPLARPNIAKEKSGLLKTYWKAGWHWPLAGKHPNSGHPKS